MKLNFIGLDQGFCQIACGCSNPNNILREVPPSIIPDYIRPKRALGSAHGASFGQPWSPWASSGPQNVFQHPWRPVSPFIPKGGSRGTYNKPWTVGSPWLLGEMGMSNNNYIPRPQSNANSYTLPKKYIPVETRREKMLKPADGFILSRRHNKTAQSSGYASSGGGRKVQGMGGAGGGFGNKAGQGFGKGPFGNKAGQGRGKGPFGNKAGHGMGGGPKETFVKKDGQLVPIGGGGGPGGKAGPGIGGGPGNKAGPGISGGNGNKAGQGGEIEKFMKKDGQLVALK